MRPPLRTAAVVAALALLLAGCGSDAGADLRRAVADVTAAANGRDADAVRDGVDTLLTRLDAALRAEAVTPQQGAEVRQFALALQAGADSIDADLIAEREAEAAQAEQQRLEQERLEAEREAAEAAAEAERQRLEEERKAAEEAQKAAKEAEKAAEEARKKAEEEAEEEDDEKVKPSPTASPAVAPSPTATAAP